MDSKLREPEPDLVAFCTVMRPELIGALRLYLRDASAAEEFAQEALARVCIHWHKVRKMDNRRAWTYKVALNLATSHLRRRQIERRTRDRLITAEPPAPSLDGSVVLRDAVRSLPPRYREAIVLRYYADLSVVETAEVLGRPENTIKTWTKRALERLQQEMSEEEEVLESVR